MIYLNNQVVEFGEFPDKTSYVDLKGLKQKTYNYIRWEYQSEREIIRLGIIKEYLESYNSKAALVITYMPHSRMDRRNAEYAFSLVAVTRMINSMNFDSVTVHDPHSDVTPALLNDCHVYGYVSDHIGYVCERVQADSVFYPDAGAQKRYEYDMPSAVGYKTRDFKTGKITSFDLIGTVGDVVLIVDDMCSKGGTLVHSANMLKEQHGAKKVYGLVSYCENTVFQGYVLNTLDGLFISAFNNMKFENKKLILI